MREAYPMWTLDYAFLPLPVKMGHLFYVSKNDFENFEKLESILIFLSFLQKFLVKAKNSPLSPWKDISSPPLLPN